MSELIQLTVLFIFLVVILGGLLTYFYKRIRKDLRELSGRPNEYRTHNETSPRPAVSASNTVVDGERKITEKRRYAFRNAEFLLEPVSDSVIRVVYGDDVAYVGMNVDWNPYEPYCWTLRESQVRADGIETSSIYDHGTIDEALELPCGRMLDAQRKRDAQRINPEERKAAARRVMREFLDELPVGDVSG